MKKLIFFIIFMSLSLSARAATEALTITGNNNQLKDIIVGDIIFNGVIISHEDKLNSIRKFLKVFPDKAKIYYNASDNLMFFKFPNNDLIEMDCYNGRVNYLGKVTESSSFNHSPSPSYPNY